MSDTPLSITISGLEVVQNRLEMIEVASRNILRQRIFDLGIELRDSARSFAPHEHGHLANSIHARIKEENDFLLAIVGPPIFYGRFFETGIDKQVEVKRKAVREFAGVRTTKLKGGGVSVRARYRRIRAASTFMRHQRLPRHPFMAPAVEMMRDKIQQELQKAIQEVRA